MSPRWRVFVFLACTALPSPMRAGAHGPIDEQIRALGQLIEDDSRRAGLYLQRGELHRHHGDWESALADYDRAAHLDPALDAVELARGKALLGARHYRPARIALERFLAGHPDHTDALITRARVLTKLDEGLAAAEDYTRAIRSGNGRPDPDHYLERARALAAEGGAHLDAALQGLDEGIAKLGPLVTLQLCAIDLEVARKHYGAALARLDSIAANSPRQEHWLIRRGEILELAGDVRRARAAYEGGLRAMASLPTRHRQTRAIMTLEARVRAALARLTDKGSEEVEP